MEAYQNNDKESREKYGEEIERSMYPSTASATTFTFVQVPGPSKTCFCFPNLTLRDIEAALLRHVSSHFGYRKEFAKQMQLSSMQNESIYIYKLETFGEMRTKGSMSTPYSGCAIDSDNNGPIPGLWDISVRPHTLFKDSEIKVSIPHTEYVTRCAECKGDGYIKCKKCSGSGVEFCEICRNNGPLMLQGDRCFYCQRWGNGGLIACCEGCGGKKELKCSICKGYEFMKHCQTLCVTWLTKVSEVTHKESRVPFIKLIEVIGTTIISEERERLQRLVFNPEPSISSLSANLISQHSGAFPYILMQRHSLRVVPLITVNYSWKGKTGEFYLYGTESKIYFKKYPAKWTLCTIM